MGECPPLWPKSLTAHRVYRGIPCRRDEKSTRTHQLDKSLKVFIDLSQSSRFYILTNGAPLQRTEQNICANNHCDKPSPYGEICYHCVDGLQEQLNTFTEHDLEELYEIALRDIRSADRNIRTTGNRALRQDALNVVAWTLWQQITHTWPDMLNTLHRQEDAKHRYHQATTGCKVARRLIEGEPETEISPQHMNEQMKKIGTFYPESASEWLWENMRIRVSQWRIRKWNQQGKLHPRTTTD